jgi:hypothetical protein
VIDLRPACYSTLSIEEGARYVCHPALGPVPYVTGVTIAGSLLLAQPQRTSENSSSRDCLENSQRASRLRSWMVHRVQNSGSWPLVTGLHSPSWGPIRISRQSL